MKWIMIKAHNGSREYAVNIAQVIRIYPTKEGCDFVTVDGNIWCCDTPFDEVLKHLEMV